MRSLPGGRPMIDTTHYHVRATKQTGEGEMVEVAFALPMGLLDDTTRGQFQQRLGTAFDVLEGRLQAHNARLRQERDAQMAEQERLRDVLQARAEYEERIVAAQAAQAAAREGANGGADPAGALHPPAAS